MVPGKPGAVRRVLITGINGFIGSHTAAAFLQAGWAVRGTVRNPASADVARLKQALEPSLARPDQLDLCPVPDITRSGAFDDAAKGLSRLSPPSLFRLLPPSRARRH